MQAPNTHARQLLTMDPVAYARSDLHGRGVGSHEPLAILSPLDSTVQTGNANGGDWQEKVYEKIKSIKEMYVSKLYRLYQKIAYELQLDSLHQLRTNEQIEKLKLHRITLEHILCFLGLNKHDIQPAHKEKLLSVERLINFFISPSQRRKPTSSPVQERLPQSSMQLQ
ncbi:hypothetical protein R3W88_010965 [Solanum pinnatisectum]|uniref:Uncharacterized protein n=1 Tax=Solanum pinnatisectum TaxID=50273 RepID=A0AAV9L8R7_9SOLN|nr:hypothetical protein R3W88_010965 [Solanum pinnatisectum]